MSKLVGRDFFPAFRNNYDVWDDFDHYVTADMFTTVATNSGTIVATDAAGGYIEIDPSSGENSEADNDETYLKGTTEMFKFANGKALVFEARVRPKFNTAGEYNTIIGLKDAVAADSILDDGAGPAASYSGAVFFLKDGDQTWWAESSIGSSQQTFDTNVTATNNTWTTLRIETIDLSSTQNEVHFFIDDVEVGWDVTTSAGNKIAQRVTFASATEMQLCLGCKNGTDNDSQVLQVDYVAARQAR